MPKTYERIDLFYHHPDIKVNNLFRAIVDNSPERLQEAIKEGADIDSISDLRLKWTPVLLAFALGRKEIYTHLTLLGANTRAVLSDGRGLSQLTNNANKEW